MIDMHVHTSKSDGTYDSAIIIDYFKNNGGELIVFTDHDVVNKECQNALVDQKLMAVRGIELTTDYPGGMHILGYALDDSEMLDMQLKKIKASYVRAILQLINKAEKELEYKFENININKITRHDLAKILVLNKVCNDRNEAYNTVLSYEKYNIKKPSVLTPEMAIKYIHEANGLAVLAHPYKNGNITFDTIKMLKEIGIDGVECFHPSHNQNDIDQMILFCESNDLLISGGSDFHSGNLSDMGRNIDYSKLTIIKEIHKRWL